MRLPRRIAPALTALTLLVALPCDAASQPAADRAPARVGDAERDPFGAGCRVRVAGGTAASAVCHNPYPAVDEVALHIECDPWWDIDTDTAPVEVGPAETVRLEGRCWKNVRTAWVSHHRTA
ncbi:hypothetical protein ACIRF8_08465 [Streptomyces sp. NPDC102406]|uniref:hypothetical protein n=1 Tax=Streptomyces sp. NPDC102406 TaxID=3366171 RepID=UPI0037FFA66F